MGKRFGWILLAGASVTLGSAAHASGVCDLGVMHKQVKVATSAESGSIDHFDGAIIGPTVSFGLPIGDTGWGWGLEGGIGWGGETNKGDLGGGPFEEKISITGWNASIQLGYMTAINKVDVYVSGGIGYESAWAKFDDGTTEVDGETFNTFGLVTTCGADVPYGEKLKLFGDLSHLYGWGSAKDGSVEFNSNVQFTEVRLGVRLPF